MKRKPNKRNKSDCSATLIEPKTAKRRFGFLISKNSKHELQGQINSGFCKSTNSLLTEAENSHDDSSTHKINELQRIIENQDLLSKAKDNEIKSLKIRNKALLSENEEIKVESYSLRSENDDLKSITHTQRNELLKERQHNVLLLAENKALKCSKGRAQRRINRLKQEKKLLQANGNGKDNVYVNINGKTKFIQVGRHNKVINKRSSSGSQSSESRSDSSKRQKRERKSVPVPSSTLPNEPGITAAWVTCAADTTSKNHAHMQQMEHDQIKEFKQKSQWQLCSPKDDPGAKMTVPNETVVNDGNGRDRRPKGASAGDVYRAITDWKLTTGGQYILSMQDSPDSCVQLVRAISALCGDRPLDLLHCMTISRDDIPTGLQTQNLDIIFNYTLQLWLMRQFDIDSTGTAPPMELMRILKQF